jgi:GGDEF domain-containing protein
MRDRKFSAFLPLRGGLSVARLADGLTALRGVDRVLFDDLNSSSRRGVALLFIDLDGFKRLNDAGSSDRLAQRPTARVT